MHRLSVDEMIEGKQSNYPLVVAVAKRAREITEDILIHGDIVTEKPVVIAFEEFKNHKYNILEP